MDINLLQLGAGVLSGALVGFMLGLAGGGGSILATPLLIYVVGIASPHVAIGTSAVVVAVNAIFGLVHYVRAGLVKWRCASVFAVAGVGGALGGAALGKAISGPSLLVWFAGLMLVVGALMLTGRSGDGDPGVRLNWGNFPGLVGAGGLTGALSGFFGIGGGFLITPALMAASGMPLQFAIASSLVAVTSFGTATAASYASSGLVDWSVALAMVAGGAPGSALGAMASRNLAAHKRLLNVAVAVIIILAAVFIGATALWPR